MDMLDLYIDDSLEVGNRSQQAVVSAATYQVAEAPIPLDMYNTTTDTDAQFIQGNAEEIILAIEKYYIPVICFLGIAGNTLSAVIFLRKPLNSSSCSIFLAAKSLVDNGFLSTLLIIWISKTFQFYLGSMYNACATIVFLSYVCGFMSAWLVVFVTIENFIRICKPFIVSIVCKTVLAKLAVLFLAVIAIGFYNFPFWAMEGYSCHPLSKHINLIQAFVYTDTVVTLVIPLCCITCFMTAIVYDLIDSYNRRARLHAPTVKRMKNPMAKVTKMLLAVTISFIVLNLPSHVFRIMLILKTLSNVPDSVTAYDQTVHHVTLAISYLSLSINAFVYFLFGSRFRRIVRDIAYRMLCKNPKSLYGDKLPDWMYSTRSRFETFSGRDFRTVEMSVFVDGDISEESAMLPKSL